MLYLSTSAGITSRDQKTEQMDRFFSSVSKAGSGMPDMKCFELYAMPEILRLFQRILWYQVKLLRKLLEEAQKVVGKKDAKLNASCEALVALAEPGDVFSAFQASMTASAVATNIKYIENRLNLKVHPLILSPLLS